MLGLAQLGRRHGMRLSTAPPLSAAKDSTAWLAGIDGDLLRMVAKNVGPRVKLQVERDVALRVLEREHRGLLGPLPLEPGLSGAKLGGMPAALLDEEDVLGRRQELERRRPCRHARSRSCRLPFGPIKRQPLVALVEADLDRRLADVRGHRHEDACACTRRSGRASTATWAASDRGRRSTRSDCRRRRARARTRGSRRRSPRWARRRTCRSDRSALPSGTRVLLAENETVATGGALSPFEQPRREKADGHSDRESLHVNV